MSSSALPQGEVKKWRVILFVIVAGLLTLLVLFGGIRDLLLFGGSLLGLLWRPLSKPLLAQFMVLGIAITCIAFATVSGTGFNPIVLVIGGVLIAILVAAYPKPRDLLQVRHEGSLSYPLLAIALIAAIFLAPIIARELNYQILGMTEHDVHALNYHWLTSVVLALLLILAGSLAATKRPGWNVLGCIVGIAFLYLGSAALFLSDYAGSWGTIGGVLGILGGLGYIIVTLLEARKGRRVIGPEITEIQGISL